MFQAELQDVRKRLRKLQRKAAKQKQKARPGQGSDGLRCAPGSSSCLVILECSGGAVDVAAEFVQGRGWLKRRCSTLRAVDKTRIETDIEAAYDVLPLAQIAALHEDPVKAGFVTRTRMLALVRWLVERSLCEWVNQQNREHGVAPSRKQLVERASRAMPCGVSDVWQRQLRLLLASTGRGQRKWLAKFRARWGFRLGRLQLRSHLSLDEKRAKAGSRADGVGLQASSFLVVFGEA